ncbi:MAG: sulfite exporter TauE/SafE family protein [Gammaproteobacteria bacterium]|nr:MAG: sulfite exporter TauE/SafE family protein [Gammaproteobacteria bacterium]
MSDLVAWVLAAGILLFGCWLQTALGFGMAVVATPIIVIIRPQWVPVVLSITALQLCLVNTWNQRQYCDFSGMLTPVLTRIPGTCAGIWLLLRMETRTLQILVAVCVLLAVLVSVSAAQFRTTPFRLGLAGFFSGLMGTSTSIGGPPMALVMQHGDPRTVRANLSLYFTYGCLISLAGYALSGLLDRQLVLISLSFLPISLLGFFTGIRARQFIDKKRFRVLLLGLCILSASVALATALLW